MWQLLSRFITRLVDHYKWVVVLPDGHRVTHESAADAEKLAVHAAMYEGGCHVVQDGRTFIVKKL